VGIAGEVLQNVLGTVEGRLGIENPFGVLSQRSAVNKTPFTGIVDGMTDIIWSMMQHISASYS
jgi:hypothetical protein